jgi:hypothetical protein
MEDSMKCLVLFYLLLVTACSVVRTTSPLEIKGRDPASVNNDSFLKDSVALISSKCSMTIVNMVKGEMVIKDTTATSVACTVQEHSANCNFLDENLKPFANREMINAVSGQEAIITTSSGGDSIVLNLVTRKYYHTANILFEHGSARGQKTCVGHFAYGKELNN